MTDVTAVPAAGQVDSSTTPQLDTTESAATSLFAGEILDGNLFPYPSMSAKERETLGMVLESVDSLLEGREAEFRDMDRNARQPPEFLQQLRELGLFGLVIPEEQGGIGLSNAAYARVLSQTSKRDSSVSLTIGAHSSIGMKGLLLFGTPEQQARYLPRLASGELIAAFCLTEAGAGSDAGSIRTSARRDADGNWILNGEKIWVTNGTIADLFTVFARTEGPGGKMSAFIVEAAWPGVSRGHHEDKMGIRASSTATVTFVDVKVPAGNLLGEEGKGFKTAMSILNNGRTGLGGGAVGGMKTLIALASKQAQDRKQFGRPIAEFGLVREKIAQMTVDCFAAESVVWMVAHYIDSHCEDYSIEAAISKVFASEAVNRAAYDALQIAAGNGFMREYPYEQAARDCRILPIFEGTNEILRLLIAMSGLKYAGQLLSDVKTAVGDIFSHPIKGFGVLSGYAGRRVVRATGVGGERVLRDCPAELKDACAVYQKYARELAAASEHLLRRYGRGVVERQYELKRLADVAIDLFVGLCVLSRAVSLADQPPGSAAQGRAIAQVFAQQAKRRMAGNIRRITRNEDETLDALAGHILADAQYPWDVI